MILTSFLFINNNEMTF